MLQQETRTEWDQEEMAWKIINSEYLTDCIHKVDDDISLQSSGYKDKFKDNLTSSSKYRRGQREVLKLKRTGGVQQRGRCAAIKDTCSSRLFIVTTIAALSNASYGLTYLASGYNKIMQSVGISSNETMTSNFTDIIYNASLTFNMTNSSFTNMSDPSWGNLTSDGTEMNQFLAWCDTISYSAIYLMTGTLMFMAARDYTRNKTKEDDMSFFNRQEKFLNGEFKEIFHEIDTKERAFRALFSYTHIIQNDNIIKQGYNLSNDDYHQLLLHYSLLNLDLHLDETLITLEDYRDDYDIELNNYILNYVDMDQEEKILFRNHLNTFKEEMNNFYEQMDPYGNLDRYEDILKSADMLTDALLPNNLGTLFDLMRAPYQIHLLKLGIELRDLDDNFPTQAWNECINAYCNQLTTPDQTKQLWENLSEVPNSQILLAIHNLNPDLETAINTLLISASKNQLAFTIPTVINQHYMDLERTNADLRDEVTHQSNTIENLTNETNSMRTQIQEMEGTIKKLKKKEKLARTAKNDDNIDIPEHLSPRENNVANDIQKKKKYRTGSTNKKFDQKKYKKSSKKIRRNIHISTSISDENEKSSRSKNKTRKDQRN